MRKPLAASKIHTLFTLAAFCLFAATLLLVLLLGANAYRGAGARAAAAYDQRIALDYIAAKIRHHDSAGVLLCADFYHPALPAAEAGIPALYLMQEYAGISYYTRIYFYDGYIRELFAEAGLDFAPADGQALLPAEELRFAWRQGLIEIVCRAGGKEERLLISPRSETGWPHD